MSEWAGPQGKQPSRIHPPSRLRHEIRAESTDDERAAEGGTLQVPDSDTVVPETQLEEFGAGDTQDCEHDADEFDGSLSPGSNAVLKRNQHAKTKSVAVAPTEVKLLSMPPLHRNSPPRSFAYGPAQKTVPKTAQNNDKSTPQGSSSKATFVSPAGSTTLANDTQVDKDAAVDEHQQDTPASQLEDHPVDEEQQQSNPLPPIKETITSIFALDAVAGADPPLDVDAGLARNRPGTGGASRPHSRLRAPGSRSHKNKQGRKGRKGKAAPRSERPWPPRPQYSDHDDFPPESGRVEQPILNVLPHTSAAAHLSNQHVTHQANGEPAPQGSSVSSRGQAADRRENAVQQCYTNTEDISHSRNAKHSDMYREEHVPSSPPALNVLPEREQGVAHEGPPTEAYPVPNLRVNPDERVQEPVSRVGANRVEKPRKKTRVGGHPRLLSPKPGALEAAMHISPEHEGLLGMMAMALRAGEHKARDIVEGNTKANETAIASLQQTVEHQNSIIEGLRVENSKHYDNFQQLREKSVKMTKYVQGIEGDYTRLKNQAIKHRDACDLKLRQKIAEVEGERVALQQEFTLATEALTRGRRTVKEALDDCYVQLIISESKKSDLAEQLNRQSGLYEEERTRRSNLEHQVGPVLQDIQQHLESSHTTLSAKLESIQESVEHTASGEERDACLKQCLDVLHSLQATPTLTAKDVQKAEGMLRFVHKGVESKLDALTNSVQENRFSSTEIQEYIRSELHTLRAEILKYDEAMAEHRKAHHANEILSQQLEHQKEQCATLSDRVSSYRQVEADMKTRYADLEHELNELKDMAREHDPDPSNLEQEMLSLRDQVKKAEEDLHQKITALDDANQRLQDQADELTKTKKMEEELKAKILVGRQLLKRDTTTKKASGNSAEIRKIEEQYQTALTEKEVAFGNDIHRLRGELADKEKTLLDRQKMLSELSEKLRNVEEDNRSIASDARKHKQASDEAQEKLQKVKQAAIENPGVSHELARLKQQLAQKTDALELKDGDLGALQKSLISMKTKSADQQQEQDRLQTKLAAEQATKEAIREKLDAQLEADEKNVSDLENARHRADLLTKEKRDLQSSLERYRVKEAQWADAQARHAAEKEGLRTELAEVRSTREAESQQFKRLRTKAAEDLKTADEKHCVVTNELKHRMTQAEKAGKDAEAKAKRVESEFDAHKKNIDEKIEQLWQEKLSLERKRDAHPSSQSGPPQSQVSQTTSAPPDVLSNLHTGKLRKKVNRQNNSVLGVIGERRSQSIPTSAQHDAFQNTYDLRDEVPDELIDPTLTGELGARERLDENGVSVVDPIPEAIPETQEALCMTFDQFHEGLGQASGTDKGRSSSSPLSDAPSSILDMDELESGANAEILHSQGHYPIQRSPHRSRNVETPRRATSGVGHDLHYPNSQDRPKSQANTGSKMMPPPATLPSVERRASSRINTFQPSQTSRNLSQRHGNEDAEDVSSPDFVHRPASSHRTYGHVHRQPASRADDRSVTPQGPYQRSSSKRKSSEGLNESASSKRQRSSSQSVRTSSSPKHHRAEFGSSGLPSNPREYNISQDINNASRAVTPARGSSTRSRRNRGRNGFGNDEMEKRFTKEMQSGGRRSKR